MTRFNFEKFVGNSPVLGLQLHSVGETMSMGSNFRNLREDLQA